MDQQHPHVNMLVVTIKNVKTSCHFRCQHNGPERCYPTWTTLCNATYLHNNIVHKKNINSKEMYWMQLPHHHTKAEKVHSNMILVFKPQFYTNGMLHRTFMFIKNNSIYDKHSDILGPGENYPSIDPP